MPVTILLVRENPHSLLDRAIAWCERSPIIHIAVDLGDGTEAEEVNGLRLRPAGVYGPETARYALPVDERTAAAMRAWLLARVEYDETGLPRRAGEGARPEPYDYLQLPLDAVNLAVGEPLFLSPFRGRRAVCSAIAAEMCAAAGCWPFAPLTPRQAAAVTPADWQRLAAGQWPPAPRKGPRPVTVPRSVQMAAESALIGAAGAGLDAAVQHATVGGAGLDPANLATWFAVGALGYAGARLRERAAAPDEAPMVRPSVVATVAASATAGETALPVALLGPTAKA